MFANSKLSTRYRALEHVSKFVKAYAARTSTRCFVCQQALPGGNYTHKFNTGEANPENQVQYCTGPGVAVWQ